MFTLFNTGITRTSNKLPLYPNINLNNIIFSQLIRFKNFMLEEDFFIDNKHPLVTLLNETYSESFMNMIPEEIAYRIKDTAVNIGNVMGLTTNRSKGKYFKDGNLRYLLFLEDDVNIKNEEYEVIKCIYTDYGILDYSYNTTLKEFMVLRVNTVELMLSYITWRKDRIKKNMIYSYNVFIATYILPKIWDTKLQQVMFNRFMLTYNNEILPRYKNRHSIQLINREDFINTENKRMVNYIKDNQKVNIYSLLYGYEWCNKDMLEVLSFDEKTFLTNTYYLLYLSRAKYVLFFLNVIFENKAVAINTEYIAELYITFRRINNGMVKLPELPIDIVDEFNDTMKKIKELINYK